MLLTPIGCKRKKQADTMATSAEAPPPASVVIIPDGVIFAIPGTPLPVT